MKSSTLTSLLIAAILGSGTAHTKVPDEPTSTAPETTISTEDQEHCITVMTSFPETSLEGRYQFFQLIEAVGEDATPPLQTAITDYSQDAVDPSTPIAETVEAIANPVLRQAAPHVPVAQMGHLIDFAARCEIYISGQIASLEAYDPSLNDPDFLQLIEEDGLFLRQILTDALFRLGANEDPDHGEAVNTYARSLVAARSDIEFASFEREIDELESLFLTDLDGRLARSNDVINGEMNAESLASAVSLSGDLNNSARQQHEQERRIRLLRILRIFN